MESDGEGLGVYTRVGVARAKAARGLAAGVMGDESGSIVRLTDGGGEEGRGGASDEGGSRGSGAGEDDREEGGDDGGVE